MTQAARLPVCCIAALSAEILGKVDKAIEPALERRRVAAEVRAESAVGFLLPQPVLRARTAEAKAAGNAGRLARLGQPVEQVVLHLDRMVQLPAELARVGDADSERAAHAEVDMARRKPGEALVRERRRRIGIDDERPQHIPRAGPGDGEDAPLGRDVPDLDPAELGALPRGLLDEEVVVVVLRGAGGDDVVVVLGEADDRGLGADRAGVGQRIGQVDAADARQLVAGQPVEEGGGARAPHAVLGEGGGVEQADALAHGLRLLDRIWPPAAAAEGARGVVVEACGRVVVRPLPAVHLAELGAARLEPVIAGRGAQRPAGRALLVRVVQDEDMVVGFLVLAGGVFAVDPRADSGAGRATTCRSRPRPRSSAAPGSGRSRRRR